MKLLNILSAMLFSFLFSFIAYSQDGKDTQWLKLISGNAVGKVDGGAFAAAKPGYALYFLQAGEIRAPYLVYVPASYDPGHASPMVVFLHGAILARENFQYADPGIADEPIFAIAEKYGVIVAFPFGKSGFMWPTQQAADDNIINIIKDAGAHYHIDKGRIYLGGISMGGIATFWFISNKPDIFRGFYTFSAMPELAGGVKFGNLTEDKPLYSMNAKDDQGFSYEEVHKIYEQHKTEAPGWHFGSVETGGHRFIYTRKDGKEIVKSLLGNLLSR